MKAILAAVALVVICGFIGLFLALFGTAMNVASAPMRVTNHTFRTENIINSYDGFYQLYNAREANIANIVSANESPATTDENVNRANMFALKATCRDLTGKYNTNAEKLTSSLFKGWDLPDRLDMRDCM